MKFQFNTLVLSLAVLAFPVQLVSSCCSQDFKNCIGWCGTTQENCTTCNSDTSLVWLSGGAVTDDCTARWGDCTQDSTSCCSGLTCVYQTEHWSQCQHIIPTEPTVSPTQAPTPVPVPTTSPTLSPTNYPTVTATPTVPSVLFSTNQTLDVYEAFEKLQSLTYEVSSSPYTLALLSSGGVAGSGDVVSEGQAYGVMISGIALASGRLDTTEYGNVLLAFEG